MFGVQFDRPVVFGISDRQRRSQFSELDVIVAVIIRRLGEFFEKFQFRFERKFFRPEKLRSRRQEADIVVRALVKIIQRRDDAQTVGIDLLRFPISFLRLRELSERGVEFRQFDVVVFVVREIFHHGFRLDQGPVVLFHVQQQLPLIPRQHFDGAELAFGRIEDDQRFLGIAFLFVQHGDQPVVVRIVRSGLQQRIVNRHRRVVALRGDQQPSELGSVPDVARVGGIGPQTVPEGGFGLGHRERGQLEKGRRMRRIDLQHLFEKVYRLLRIAVHDVVLDPFGVIIRTRLLRRISPVCPRFRFRSIGRTGRAAKQQRRSGGTHAKRFCQFRHKQPLRVF